MGPLGTSEAREVGKIFVENSGCGGLLDHSIPDGRTRRFAILKSLQFAAVGKVDKNNFAAAIPKLLHSSGNVVKTLFNRLAHLFRKLFCWNVSRRRRRSKERQPDLLNRALQFSRSGAFLDHSRATFTIQSPEVRGESRRDQGVCTIGNGQTF